MKGGEVYWADIEPRSGSEQQGRRPVIIISHDGFNLTRGWRSVIVVPLSTSRVQAARGSSVVPIPQGVASLPRDCFAICHQVTRLDRSKVSTRIGELTPANLFQIEEGLKAAMDLN